MVVGLSSTHDIRLESSDDAAPTTTVDLMLALDEDKSPRWRELRLPPFPPRQSQGAVSYAHHDPSRDLIFSQKDWSGGALQTVYDPDHPDKYAKATGVDLRWPNTAVLGQKLESRIDFLVRNPGAEVNNTTGWTVPAGHTLTNVTTSPRTGSRHFSVATTGTAVFTYKELANPTALRGASLTLTVYIKRSSGSGNLNIRLSDSVGDTNAAVVANTTTYTFGTVTRVIDATATFIRLGVYDDNSTGTFFFDDIVIRPGTGVTCQGLAENNDILYGIFSTAGGGIIAQWDETNDVWDAVYLDNASALTSIVNYNGNIFVATGGAGDSAYVYGATTSWTVSTLVGDAKFAYYFTVSRQTLWKSRADGTGSPHIYLASSTNAVNGGSWSAEYTVGSTDRAVTSLNNFQDSLLVGKEDGLYLYLRVYNDGANADLFKNLTNEWANFVSVDNFSRMREWHGWMYMTASQQSLFRYNGSEYQDISSLLAAPRLTSDFGGRVRALTNDPAQLWFLMDSGTADTVTAKKTWLFSLRDVQGKLLLHTMEQVSIGDVNWLEANRGYLWSLGRIYNSDAANYESAIYRWVLPTKNIAPAYDSSPSINTGGNFDTSVWDGDLPDEQKAFIALTLFVKPSVLDANHTIIVKFGTDGASPTTTTLGTYSGAGAIQTKFFDTITAPETNAVGRSIQLNFALASNNTVSPELYALALHSTLRPDRVKVYEAFVYIGDGVIQHNGLPDPQGKTAKLTDLLTLENQVYPIRLTADFNQDGTNELSQQAVQIVPGSLERAPTEERVNGVEVWRLLLQEVAVS